MNDEDLNELVAAGTRELRRIENVQTLQALVVGYREAVATVERLTAKRELLQ